MNLQTSPIIVAVTAVMMLASAAVAQDQGVSWKFAQGDQFLVVQQQATLMDTQVDKRSSKIDSSVQLTMTWNVTEVADDQTATIEQTVDSIKVMIVDPANASQSVAIDTDSQSRPARNSRELLKQLKSAVGIQFVTTMSDRGEILSVELADASQEKLAAIPAESWLKALLDPGKLQAQIMSSMIVLPAELVATGPEVGQSWELDLKTNPATVMAIDPGKKQLTYVGSKQVGIDRLDEFKLSTVKKFDVTQTKTADETVTGTSPGVATFEWSGQLLFHRQAGHGAKCDSQTIIKTESSHGEMEIKTTVTVDSDFELQRK